MAPKQPNVKLHPVANAALEQLQKDLPKAGMPRETRREDIVSAVVFYMTPLQAAGMISAFLQHVENMSEAGDAESPPTAESERGDD
jgi:hypothetical protein